MSKRTVDFTGTVSSATMRAEDVLPAIMGVLGEYHPDAYDAICEAIIDDYGITYNYLCNPPSDDFMGVPVSEHWHTETMSYIINEEAWDAMQEIAPEGHYFGAHPGDGCDYGFWAIEEYDL